MGRERFSMNVTRLRTIMRRYKGVGVLLVGTYLSGHHLWTKRRNLLLLVGFTLIGISWPFWRLRDAPPSWRPALPLSAVMRPQVVIPPPAPQALVRKTPDYTRGTQKLPYYAQWGSYRIVVERYDSDESGSPQRVRILGLKNEVLREVRAWGILSVELAKMTGHSPEELHISLWSGGAYASGTEVYFSQAGGLHNILTFDRDDQEEWSVLDLNHDGIPEIVAQNPVLGDFSAYNFHRHWPVITILDWDGRRYVDVTARYPARSLQEAFKRRKDIQECLQTPRRERRDWDFQDKITAYYANMLAIGRGNTARRWLQHHLESSDWAWVQEHDAELHKVVATTLERRGHVSQDKVIEQ